MKRLLWFLIFLIFPPPPLPAQSITFGKFAWGISICDVELRAGEEGFKLIKKISEPAEAKLIYRAPRLGEKATVTFFFTPATKKLFNVQLSWEGTSWGYILLEQLREQYHTPRTDIPALHTYIWTQENTEVELRHHREETILLYSDLNLWKMYQEEIKKIDEQEKQKSEQSE